MTSALMTMIFLLGAAEAQARSPLPEAGLVAALRDPDPDVRALAAGILAESADPREDGAVDALAARLVDLSEDWRVRVAAAEALANQAWKRSELTERLVERVVDEADDWRVRAASLSAARARGGDSSLERALAAAGDVRISNGRSSISLKDPLADGAIFDALTDPDARMRSLARTALDSGLAIAGDPLAATPDLSPWLSELLNQLFSHASPATGTLTVY